MFWKTCFRVFVSLMSLFLVVPWVGLWSVMMVFWSNYIRIRLKGSYKNIFYILPMLVWWWLNYKHVRNYWAVSDIFIFNFFPCLYGENFKMNMSETIGQFLTYLFLTFSHACMYGENFKINMSETIGRFLTYLFLTFPMLVCMVNTLK